MQEFLDQHKGTLRHFFPQVRQYEQQLSELDNWWGKVSLIGKINCLKVGGTILESMDVTKQRFQQLQQRLIDQLLHEQGRGQLQADQARCQVAMDLLIRNLFERTADIGFLACDAMVQAYLQQQQPDQVTPLLAHLQRYCSFYSVYDDVLLFDAAGNLLLRLDSTADPALAQVSATEPFVRQALAQRGQFLEYCGPSRLFARQSPSLLYCQTVQAGDQVLGLLCLSFRFQHELSTIARQLLAPGSVLQLTGPAGEGLFCSAPELLLPTGRLSAFSVQQHNRQLYLACSATSIGYQGYFGPNWQVQLWTPAEALQPPRDAKTQAGRDQLELFPQLQEIRRDSTRVNDELNLIVLNGVIAAARRSAEEFVPVLDAIRGIGQQINQVFTHSVGQLDQTVLSTQLQELQAMAVQAVDMLDRNLYERANDCRWWAQNPRFRQLLALTQRTAEQQQQLAAELSYINSLYTVYSNICLFASDGQILAAASPLDVTEMPADSQSDHCLQLRDASHYVASCFVPTVLYDGRPTYLFQAPVFAAESSAAVGGIALVFDAAPQFSAMLRDVLPKTAQGLIKAGFAGCFIDEHGKVLASSDDVLLATGSTVGVSPQLLQRALGGPCGEWVSIDGADWLVTLAPARGYREFRTSDGYPHAVLACFLQKS